MSRKSPQGGGTPGPGVEGTPKDRARLLAPLHQRLKDGVNYPDADLRIGSAQLMIKRMPQWVRAEADAILRRAIAELPAWRPDPQDPEPRDTLPIGLNATGGFVLTLRDGREVTLAEGPGLMIQLRALLQAAQTPRATARQEARRRIVEYAEGAVTRLPHRAGKNLRSATIEDLDL